MFSQLNHKSLNVYKALRELVKECYLLTRSLPPSLSVKLNIAEGSSRRSEAERKRLYEIARGSVIEIDAAIETALDLEFFTFKEATNVRVL
jgi:four helix bundle protein